MREIIFRGKKKNGADKGKWFYGSLIQVFNGSCSIWNSELIDDIEVEPKTVGQYTGLTDKRGNKIFEGDYITCLDGQYTYRGTVRFLNGNYDDVVLSPPYDPSFDESISCFYIEVEQGDIHVGDNIPLDYNKVYIIC